MVFFQSPGILVNPKNERKVAKEKTSKARCSTHETMKAKSPGSREAHSCGTLHQESGAQERLRLGPGEALGLQVTRGFLELTFLCPFCVTVLPCTSACLMRAKLASEDFSHMPGSFGKATPQPCQDQRLGAMLSQSLFFVLK